MIEKTDLILILFLVREYQLVQWQKRKARFLTMYQTIQQPRDMSLTHHYIGDGQGFYVFTVQIGYYELIWYYSEGHDIFDSYFQWQMVYINLIPGRINTRVYNFSEDLDSYV